MSESNKELVRRVVDEIWNQGRMEKTGEFAADTIVVHMPAGTDDIHGPDGIRQYYSMLREGFPDIQFTINDQIAEGDLVVTRWTAIATHTGEFMGFPPTGKRGVMTGVDIDRFAGGKVVECWPVTDDLGFLQQLGLLPSHPSDTAHS